MEFVQHSQDKIVAKKARLLNEMDDIEQDLEEFANYVLEAIKQSEGDKSNWDEILRKWKLIEKKKDLEQRKKLR